jgi:hypothetical protein
MQLLEHEDTGEIRLMENLIWDPEEVPFRDLTDSTDKNRVCYADIRFGRGRAQPMVYSWVDRKLSVRMVSAGIQDPCWIHDDFEVRITVWLGIKVRSNLIYRVYVSS